MALHAPVFGSPRHPGFPAPRIGTLNPKPGAYHETPSSSSLPSSQRKAPPLPADENPSDAPEKKNSRRERRFPGRLLPLTAEDRPVFGPYARTGLVENAPLENTQEIALHVEISTDDRSDGEVSMENEPIIWVSMENPLGNEPTVEISTENGLAPPAHICSEAEGVKFTSVLHLDRSTETRGKATECIDDEPNTEGRLVSSSEARKPQKLGSVSFEPDALLDPGGVSLKNDSNVTIELQLESNVCLNNVVTRLESIKSLENVLTDGETDQMFLVNNELVTSIKDQVMQDYVSNGSQTSDYYPWSLMHHKDVEVKGSDDTNMKGNGENSGEVVEDKAAKKNVEIEVSSFEKNKQQIGNAEKEQRMIGRTIRKRFGRKYFNGTIKSYDSENSWYKVLYEDGDQEDLEEGEVEALLLPSDDSPGPSSRKRKPPERDMKERRSKGKRKDVKEFVLKSEDIGFESDGEEESPARRVSFTSTTLQAGILRYLSKREDSGQSPVSKDLTKKKERETSTAEAPETAKSMNNYDDGTGISETGTLVCKTPGRFCSGRINDEIKHYTMRYEDDEKEDCEWKELQPILASSPTPSSKTKKSGHLQLGASSVGMVARKKLGKRIHTGTVVSYNKQTQLYKVKYDNGHQEEFEWTELKPMLAFGKKLKCNTNISFENDIDKELHISTSENVVANSSQHHNKEREAEGDNSLSPKVGDLLIGSSTLKRFGRKMYAGKVISYNKKRKVYRIKYEDGDQEELEWVELQPTLVQQCRQSSADLDTDHVHKELESGGRTKRKGSSSRKTKVRKSITASGNTGAKFKNSLVNGDETPLELGIALIGRSLMKEFSGKVYTGKVIDYDARTKFYKVKYEDGDQEDLEWRELELVLVAD